MAEGFRAAWRADVPWRVLDLGLHVLAASMLPGPWLLQWAPDVLVLPLWLRGMAQDRMAPDGDRLLRLHRMLHLRLVPPLDVVPYLTVAYWTGQWWLLAHVAVHVLIDRLTHDAEWQ